MPITRGGPLSSKSGMTVVEIMIVVTIIGILVVIAIPFVREARRRSQDTAFINSLRVLTGSVFDYSAFEQGDFPPDVPPGVPPPSVTNALPNRFDWAGPTDIGGQWDWERAPARGQLVHGVCYAGLAVYQPARTTEELQVIDARCDDGDLATGLFRAQTNGCIFVVQY
ncbi:MAG: prepilin-type N-terminal cleavage/methylation domain-containing protein [Lentisphaerae bacterium]|nr:prepilin-type N-terminal cleavage/methylation domain-containing protein [Lentisphaerota bacterium]